MCQRQNTGRGGPQGRPALANPTFSSDFISLSSSKRRHLPPIYSQASFIALLPCRGLDLYAWVYVLFNALFHCQSNIKKALGKVGIRLKECRILHAPSEGCVLQSALSHLYCFIRCFEGSLSSLLKWMRSNTANSSLYIIVTASVTQVFFLLRNIVAKHETWWYL